MVLGCYISKFGWGEAKAAWLTGRFVGKEIVAREELIISLLIFLARVVDVSLGTFRVIALVRGRKLLATLLGFFECLVWVMAISKVALNLDEPIFIVAYAAGFAAGNFVGLTIEHKLAWGEQVVRIISRCPKELVRVLREAHHKVTVFQGEGRDGPVSLLFAKASRRNVKKIVQIARQSDPTVFCFVDDAMDAVVEPAKRARFLRGGWRRLLSRK